MNLEEQKILYKKLMIETSKQTGIAMLAFLESVKKDSPNLFEIVAELPRKKIGTFETRAYFMRMAYEICSGKQWSRDVVYACAAVTFELCSMYNMNRVFDEKGGKEILANPNLQIIAGMINKGLATRALANGCQNLSQSAFINVLNKFDHGINQQVYYGQYIDLEENIYKKEENQNWEKMKEKYLERCYLINGVFYEEIAEIASVLGNGSQKNEKALKNFGKYFGITQQIVNDIADFVPPEKNQGTEEKVPDDSYSDFKHGKLTLPIIYSLINGTNNEKKMIMDMIGDKNIETDNFLKLTKMLVKNRSIEYSINTAIEYARNARSCLDELMNTEKEKPLWPMLDVAYTNRYYKALREL